MARTKGMLNLSGNLEVNAGAPLDARSVVPTVADLTVASNFQYKYIGMHVTVQDTGDMYTLLTNDVTDIANWKKVGSGGGGNINDETPTFTEAGTRANIASGEKISVIMGKIQKFFTDLKTVAFSGSYSDLSNKPTIPDELADLTADSTHRVVTDTQISSWNGKQAALTAGTGIDITNDVISAIGGGGGVSYSTTEQNTGLKWIDGKTIYQKTFTGTVPTNGSITLRITELVSGATNIISDNMLFKHDESSTSRTPGFSPEVLTSASSEVYVSYTKVGQYIDSGETLNLIDGYTITNRFSLGVVTYALTLCYTK